MKKPRGKERIEVVTDKDFDDLLIWNYIKNKDNKVTKSHMIIRKDLPNWTLYHIHNGWIKVEDPVETSEKKG